MRQQIVNKAVEIGVSSQLEEVEKLDINIKSQLSDLVAGKVKSAAMRGKGIVTPQNLSVAEILLKTDSVAVNLLKAATGKIELSQPTDASARIILHEADLNRALNSDYLRDLLRSFSIPTENKSLHLELQQGNCSLPEPGKVVLEAELLVHIEKKTQPIAFSIALRFEDGGSKIILEGGRYLESKKLPFPATVAILTKVNELLRLRSFRSAEVWLKLEQIEVATGEIIVWIKAHLEEIPAQADLGR